MKAVLVRWIRHSSPAREGTMFKKEKLQKLFFFEEISLNSFFIPLESSDMDIGVYKFIGCIFSVNSGRNRNIP